MTDHEGKKALDEIKADLARDPQAKGRTVRTSALIAIAEYVRHLESVSAEAGDQEPLGPEFEAVWDANADSLYES